MLEWALVPALIGLAAFTPPGKPNDKKKIKTIFENMGFGIRNNKGDPLYPKYKKKVSIEDGGEEIGMRYLYTMPLGLPVTKMAEAEKHVGIFSDGLNRPVIVEFKRENPKVTTGPKYLTISVFNRDLPHMYPYAKVPDKEGWVIPLGRTLEETIWHDFEKIPHMTVAGTTRFGKTVFLKVLVTYLIEHHPDDVEFYIIDLKGGLEFGRYEKLKQVKRVASDPIEAYQLLQEVHGNMQDTYKLFKQNHWTNISNTSIKKRTFIIVDEAAQLAPEKWMATKEKELLGACQWHLGEISRIGGGLGFREVYCTQYPTSDTLPRTIKMNSDSKISFRLPAGYASEVAIDERGAENLPSDIKGRALYKTHELKQMQVPLIYDKDMWERLSQYEVSNPIREEETTPGGNYVEFGGNAVRHKGSNSKKASTRNGPKRPKNPKRNEGVSSNQEPRREERILPERKGKRTGRTRGGNQVDSTGGPPPNEE
jgi:S-DNA-T family DNA segregation ATPase FtsK/SpoIIIE